MDNKENTNEENTNEENTNEEKYSLMSLFGLFKDSPTKIGWDDDAMNAINALIDVGATCVSPDDKSPKVVCEFATVQDAQAFHQAFHQALIQCGVKDHCKSEEVST